MTISGRRTKQLDIFCRITGFASDFLSFIVVELIRFFHEAIQFAVFPAGYVPQTVLIVKLLK